MDNIWRNLLQARTCDNVLPLRKVWQSLRLIMVLEESRTTMIARNKTITALPARDGLTIIIYKSVEGNALKVPKESITRGGSNSDSWLEPKWKQVRSSSSTSIFACIGTSTTMPIPWYVNRVFINLCVSGRYCGQCDGNGTRKKSWCIESQNLMPLATDNYKGNVFWFMKSEESMAGEVSERAGTCYDLAGTNFMIGKIKFWWRFRSSKGPESE